MKDEILDLVEKVKETRNSVSVVDGVTVLLRMRYGYMDGESGWVVEAIVVSNGDIAALRKYFPNKNDAVSEYERLKNELGAEDIDIMGGDI